ISCGPTSGAGNSSAVGNASRCWIPTKSVVCSGTHRGVWQPQQVFHPADRAHGFPDADEVRLADRTAEGRAELRGEVQTLSCGIGWVTRGRPHGMADLATA